VVLWQPFLKVVAALMSPVEALPHDLTAFVLVYSSLCEAMFDWGGVSKDFWKRAVIERHWPVDVKSIVIEDAALFPLRYHVAMRKLKTMIKTTSTQS
jgi:hypothetical protein